LGYVNPPFAVDTLAQTLKSRDEDVAYFSILALGNIKEVKSARVLLAFLEKNVFRAHKIVSLLETFPDSIVDEVIKVACSPNPVARFWAVKLLTKFKPQQCLVLLARLTKDVSADVRAAACECLGELQDAQAKDFILPALKDPAWFVRMHAIRALLKVAGKECQSSDVCIKETIRLIEDDSWPVKEAVRKAMAQNIEAALPYIEDYLKGEDRNIKIICIGALMDSGYLPRLLNDLLSARGEKAKKAMQLFKDLIASGLYFGFRKMLLQFDTAAQKKILEITSAIDKDFALRIKTYE
jgi:HEAT repeat protein